MTTRNNRWTHGKGHFSMSALPAQLQSAEGIAPHQLVLDPAIGSEMALLWLDRTPFVFDLAKVTPFDLRLKSGLVRTSQGPFFFLLFYVPDPKHPGSAFSAMDAHVNAYDTEHMQMW